MVRGEPFFRNCHTFLEFLGRGGSRFSGLGYGLSVN